MVKRRQYGKTKTPLICSDIEGYVQYNDDGEWVGLDKDEKTIVTTKSSMADVKSALDVIFDKKKKSKNLKNLLNQKEP